MVKSKTIRYFKKVNVEHYLAEFQKAATALNHQALREKGLEVATGIVLNSSFLKLYKKSWANKFQDPLASNSRIFFSIWMNDSTIKKQSISYNIHALKLRHLEGYKIESRKFATAFRSGFEVHKHRWPNVSVEYGPLTLMEGWLPVNIENFQHDITILANNFIEIEYLIDDSLAMFKRR